MNRAGERRSVVRLESKTTVVDPAFGGFTATWSLFHRAWAKVETTSQNEGEIARGVAVTGGVVLTIPWTPRAVTTGMRAIWRGRKFMVNGVVNPGERNEELVLSCTEIP